MYWISRELDATSGSLAVPDAVTACPFGIETHILHCRHVQWQPAIQDGDAKIYAFRRWRRTAVDLFPARHDSGTGKSPRTTPLPAIHFRRCSVASISTYRENLVQVAHLQCDGAPGALGCTARMFHFERFRQPSWTPLSANAQMRRRLILRGANEPRHALNKTQKLVK